MSIERLCSALKKYYTDNLKKVHRDVSYQSTDWFDNNLDYYKNDYDYQGLSEEQMVHDLIDARFYDFISDLRNKAKEDEGKILATRCISVTDVDEFLFHVANGTPLPEYDGLGIFWSWDEDKAECHWGRSNGKRITVHALVPFESIDIRGTLMHNLDMSLGEDEAELTVKEGAEIYVAGVQVDSEYISPYDEGHDAIPLVASRKPAIVDERLYTPENRQARFDSLPQSDMLRQTPPYYEFPALAKALGHLESFVMDGKKSTGFNGYSYDIPNFSGPALSAAGVSDLYARFEKFNKELFDGQLPKVLIEIVNNTNPKWLGQFEHRWKKNKETGETIATRRSIKMQKAILGDTASTDRVLVHEMIHLWQQVNGHADEHGVSFEQKMNEINKKLGEEFVTKKSDQTYEKAQKPFYLVIWNDPYFKTHLYGYVPKPMTFRHKTNIGRREDDPRYIETTDPKWLTSKSLGYSGGYRASEEKVKELVELYEKATPLDDSFPKVLKISDFKKAAAFIDPRYLQEDPAFRTAKDYHKPVDQTYGWGLGKTPTLIKVLNAGKDDPLNKHYRTKKVARQEPWQFEFEKEVFNDIQSSEKPIGYTDEIKRKNLIEQFSHRVGYFGNVLRMRVELYCNGNHPMPDWVYTIASSDKKSATLHAVYFQVGKDMIKIWDRGNVNSTYPWKRFEQQAHKAGYKLKEFSKNKIEPSGRGYWLNEEIKEE
jgi:hypothetical protein